jgi:hypothetical protein
LLTEAVTVFRVVSKFYWHLWGSEQSIATLATRQSGDRWLRPKPVVHSFDQMTHHRSDSGHSFQVQQSHGSEGRFSGTFQT